jgi:hypothetical protein
VRPPPYPRNDRPLVFFLAFGLVLAAWAGTQYVAWRFAFHPNLGSPLVVLDAPAARLLRAACVLAAGSAASALLVAPLRRLCVPLLLLALGAGLGSVGPLYAPHGIFAWHAANARVPAAASIFRVGWGIVGAAAVLVSFAVAGAWRRRRRPPPPTRTDRRTGGAGIRCTRTRGSFSAGRGCGSSGTRARGTCSPWRRPARGKG